MAQITKLVVIVFLTLSPFIINAQSKKNQNEQLLEEAKKAIAASNAVFFTSFEKNDSSILINCYTADACLMPGNKPIACGRDALEKFFRAAYDIGRRGGKFITTNVYGNGDDYVTEEGIGEVYDVNGKVYDKFKYLVLWKRTKEGWKMHRDSFSSNNPQK